MLEIIHSWNVWRYRCFYHICRRYGCFHQTPSTGILTPGRGAHQWALVISRWWSDEMGIHVWSSLKNIILMFFGAGEYFKVTYLYEGRENWGKVHHKYAWGDNVSCTFLDDAVRSKLNFSFSSYTFLNTQLFYKTQSQLVINTSLLLTMQYSCNMSWATTFTLICLWYSHMVFHILVFRIFKCISRVICK